MAPERAHIRSNPPPRWLVGVLICLFGVTWSLDGVAQQQGANSSSPAAGGDIVVLDIRGPDDTSSLRQSLDRVLRDTVQGAGDYTLVNQSGTSLSEMMVVVGCNTVDASCLTQATEQFGARFLLFGDITGSKKSREISVRLFDAVQGSYLRSFASELAEMSPPYDKFRRDIETLLDPTASAETLLYVSANVPNAAVRIDGREVGATPLRRRGIPPGEYRIVVDHPDYEQWTTIIELVEGGDVRLRAPLKPLKPLDGTSNQKADRKRTSPADPAESEQGATGAKSENVTTESGVSAPGEAQTAPAATGASSTERADVMNWGPWLAIGVGGAGLIGGGLVGIHIQEIESDLAEWRQANVDRPGCQGQECTLLQRGRRAETAHRVLLGAGGVTMASGLLWLLLRPKKKTKRADSRPHLGIRPFGAGVAIGATW